MLMQIYLLFYDMQNILANYDLRKQCYTTPFISSIKYHYGKLLTCKLSITEFVIKFVETTNTNYLPYNIKMDSQDIKSDVSFRRKPDWLKIKLPHGFKTRDVIGLLNDSHIHTICSSGMCPNRAECWGAGTATFMIGGNICTRNCKFCNVSNAKPGPLDEKEIDDIAESVKKLHLRHVVMTSVTRDDLPDQGANHWAKAIRTIKERCPGVTMEVLIPDFRGDTNLLDIIIDAHPEIISHNMETVERLTPDIRSVATYKGSLHVLRYLSSKGVKTKTGIMLGLGESREEIIRTMDDVLSTGCQIMTLGQYLQPSKNHYPVQAYITPETFDEYGKIGKEKGFRHFESAPMVRSSYHAERHIH